MPITVTALVAPSRRLRMLLAAFCASLFAASLAVCFVLPAQFAPAAWLPLLLAGCAIGHAWRAAGADLRRIDFSGVGRLRLTVQRNTRSPFTTAVSATVLPGATVWPCCMLLRLRADDTGAVWRLVLLPDSMAPGAYRALAVALRAMGAGASTKIL
ncbi:protein YgfX [Massilia sp. DD77]|uniref:protein YgfX n=1 Tax=Massilia sp. DD77 TaxID=3109349 RepID=UPI0030005771